MFKLALTINGTVDGNPFTINPSGCSIAVSSMTSNTVQDTTPVTRRVELHPDLDDEQQPARVSGRDRGQAPVVTTQPAASTTLDVGQTLTLTAAATGTPTPTVQWYFGSTSSPISGATSNDAVDPERQAANAGQYFAVFTNTAGTAQTNNATVTVNPVADVHGLAGLADDRAGPVG